MYSYLSITLPHLYIEFELYSVTMYSYHSITLHHTLISLSLNLRIEWNCSWLGESFDDKPCALIPSRKVNGGNPMLSLKHNFWNRVETIGLVRTSTSCSSWGWREFPRICQQRYLVQSGSRFSHALCVHVI
jgi:hypothetical protein